MTTLRHAPADGANVTFAGRTIQVQHLAAEASRHDHPDSATLLTMTLLELTARQEHGPHARLRGSVAADHPSVPDTTVYHLVVETRSGERLPQPRGAKTQGPGHHGGRTIGLPHRPRPGVLQARSRAWRSADLRP